MNPPVKFYELLETGDFSVLFYDADAAGSASRETERQTGTQKVGSEGMPTDGALKR